jgi:AraC-like DNA-binding protein
MNAPPSDGPGMALRIVQPSEPLRRFLSGYFLSTLDLPQPVTDHAVPEWGGIRIMLEGAFEPDLPGIGPTRVDQSYVQGPSSKAVRFTIQRCRQFGIGLLPEAFVRFWDVDVSALANGWLPIEALLGAEAEVLAGALAGARDADAMFAIADRFMLGLLADTRPSPATDTVARLHRALNDPATVRIEDLTEKVGLAPSTLANLCKRRFGFPPNLLLRRQRFLRLLEALHARPYAEWPDFVDPNYTDQSHMIREFRFFMGMSPTQYLAQPRLIQQASAAFRREALGGALQGLA